MFYKRACSNRRGELNVVSDCSDVEIDGDGKMQNAESREGKKRK